MIFYCGKICSGKSTIARLIANKLNVPFVEVSDIVKQHINSNKRDSLQGHPELDICIINYLKTMPPDTVVSGVRQVSILEAFSDSEFVWIDVCYSVRKKRYLVRSDNKDASQEFDKANQKDTELGINDVRNYILGKEI